MKTNAFYDLHVHVSKPDIDNNLFMLNDLSALGLERINLAAINYLSHPVDENIRVLYCKLMHRGAKVSAFGGLYYDECMNHYGRSFLDQANTLMDMGCDGIKMIENKPNYRRHIGFGLNCKLYDDMFDMLEEKQIPVLMHVNDPEVNWDRSQLSEAIIQRGWCYDDRSYLTYEDIYGEVFERMDKNPKLRVIFAHFLFLSNDLERAERILEAYPNAAFDLTPGWEMYVGFSKRLDDWRAFFEKYSHRIYYGTDTSSSPINPRIHDTVRAAISRDSAEFEMPHVPDVFMRGLDLSQRAQENICFRNFIALIGEPRPVNRTLLIEEAEMLCARLAALKCDSATQNRLQTMIQTLKK